MLVGAPIHCPACQGTAVVQYGKTAAGKPRFRCQHETCTRVTLIRESVYQGRLASGKRHMMERSLHASGMRDIAQG